MLEHIISKGKKEETTLKYIVNLSKTNPQYF